ncbi:hypothetical protein [Oryza sativa Japonica Group]|uniref:Uncharacterized protein P0501G01.19 n=1 Tax=Oryza sativa subsp. japonica TaxID=39947 RepID=Q9AXA1_ORYSJ|nr:hypothetical protein [Oryza sativa Japonica Group]
MRSMAMWLLQCRVLSGRLGPTATAGRLFRRAGRAAISRRRRQQLAAAAAAKNCTRSQLPTAGQVVADLSSRSRRFRASGARAGHRAVVNVNRRAAAATLGG